MTSVSATHKKRKREENDGGQPGFDLVTFTVVDKDISAVGPLLATFPAFQPLESIPFSVYSKPGSSQKDSEKEFALKNLLTVGETRAVDFCSTKEGDDVAGNCRYLIGVRNKKTNTIMLRPAPMHILSRRVKALKNLAPAPSISLSERSLQRNILGETFGTKKAQKAIRASERNKVDVSAMDDVTVHIQASIDSNTKTLPTQEEAKQIADSNRNIPPYDLSATSPENIYKISDIIPDSEFNVLTVKNLMSAKSMDERMSFVPCRWSQWIRQHINTLCSSPKPNRKLLKLVLYIACLLTYRESPRRLCKERDSFHNKLQGIPSAVADGIISRFSETRRGSDDVTFTKDNEISLMTHIFALCLHVDNFATDTTLLAADLHESVNKINDYFKLLGCKIEKLSASEMNRLGLEAITEGHKRAILTAPLEFSKARLKRRK